MRTKATRLSSSEGEKPFNVMERRSGSVESRWEGFILLAGVLFGKFTSGYFSLHLL